LYKAKKDIDKIGTMMKHIQEGKLSRNKHFFSLKRITEYRCFRRAKLFLSVLEDLRTTSSVEGNSIEIIEKQDQVQLNLFNPNLRYSRKIHLTNAELKLLTSNTDIGMFKSVSSHKSS